MSLAWLSLGAAFLGVVDTPRNYCGELPTPTGEAVVEAGLAIAFVATLVPVSIESFRGSGVRTTLAWLVIGALTFAVLAGLGVLEAHRTASWGCG